MMFHIEIEEEEKEEEDLYSMPPKDSTSSIAKIISKNALDIAQSECFDSLAKEIALDFMFSNQPQLMTEKNRDTVKISFNHPFFHKEIELPIDLFEELEKWPIVDRIREYISIIHAKKASEPQLLRVVHPSL